MTDLLLKALLVAIAGSLVGCFVNIVSPNGIPFVIDIEKRKEEETQFRKLDVNIEMAKDYLEQGYIFIDARPPERFEEGHIPGAINIPEDNFQQKYWKYYDLLNQAPGMVVYCDGDECDLSKHVAQMLKQEAGFENVKIFFGGWEIWLDHDMPQETGKSVF